MPSMVLEQTDLIKTLNERHSDERCHLGEEESSTAYIIAKYANIFCRRPQSKPRPQTYLLNMFLHFW